MFSLSRMVRSASQHSRLDPYPGTFFVRNPFVVVAVVILLSMIAAYVYVLHEAVVGAERTRESWRATEVEKVQARAMVRDLRVRPQTSP